MKERIAQTVIQGQGSPWMANTRWEVWTIASCISERDLVFETINGKHLYHTGSGNNYMLNPQCEEKIQVTGTPF